MITCFNSLEFFIQKGRKSKCFSLFSRVKKRVWYSGRCLWWGTRLRGHHKGSLNFLIPVLLWQAEMIFAKMFFVCRSATASAVRAKSPAGVDGGTWKPHFVPHFVPKYSLSTCSNHSELKPSVSTLTYMIKSWNFCREKRVSGLVTAEAPLNSTCFLSCLQIQISFL